MGDVKFNFSEAWDPLSFFRILDSLLQRLPPRFAKAHGIVKLVNERKQSINAHTLDQPLWFPQKAVGREHFHLW